MRINFPNDNPAGFTYIHCREISDKQVQKLQKLVNENWGWRYTQTCASFASDVFYEVTNVDINADDIGGFETPREVGDSIIDANNGKASNLDNVPRALAPNGKSSSN